MGLFSTLFGTNRVGPKNPEDVLGPQRPSVEAMKKGYCKCKINEVKEKHRNKLSDAEQAVRDSLIAHIPKVLKAIPEELLPCVTTNVRNHCIEIIVEGHHPVDTTSYLGGFNRVTFWKRRSMTFTEDFVEALIEAEK